MARKKTKRGGRRRGGRPPNKGPAYDIAGLRKKIGRANGVAQISRATLAELLGAAVGSIVNWERGKPPRPSYVAQLKDLERKADAGDLKISVPRRGRAPKAPRAAVPAGRRGRRAAAPAVEPSGAAPVLYANYVRVEEGSLDARVRFALIMPGKRDVRAVADVIVPREVISALR